MFADSRRQLILTTCMSNILIEQIQHVLTITISRADKYNALTPAMYDAMADALQSATDKETKVVLLQGEGPHFTAGNDLSHFASVEDEEHVAETVRFMHALMDCPVPVVAKIKGQTVGIGTTMLLHCDFVYSDNSAHLCMPFINLALVPEFASSWILPARVGHAKAAEWLMLGEPIGADEAFQYGLINKVLPENELDEYVSAIVHKLACKPGIAMRHTKALLKQNMETVKLHMADELDVFFGQLNTEAAKEAFAAFLEKRSPDPQKFK